MYFHSHRKDEDGCDLEENEIEGPFGTSVCTKKKWIVPDTGATFRKTNCQIKFPSTFNKNTHTEKTKSTHFSQQTPCLDSIMLGPPRLMVSFHSQCTPFPLQLLNRFLPMRPHSRNIYLMDIIMLADPILVAVDFNEGEKERRKEREKERKRERHNDRHWREKKGGKRFPRQSHLAPLKWIDKLAPIWKRNSHCEPRLYFDRFDRAAWRTGIESAECWSILMAQLQLSEQLSSVVNNWSHTLSFYGIWQLCEADRFFSLSPIRKERQKRHNIIEIRGLIFLFFLFLDFNLWNSMRKEEEWRVELISKWIGISDGFRNSFVWRISNILINGSWENGSPPSILEWKIENNFFSKNN